MLWKVKEVENYVSLKGKWNKPEVVIEDLDYLGPDVPKIIINWFFKKKNTERNANDCNLESNF